MGFIVNELTIENYQRIRALRIKPKDGVVEISGPNAAGKSSVIGGIWSALAGARARPEKPLRKGAGKGSVGVELKAAEPTEIKVGEDDEGVKTITTDRLSVEWKYSQKASTLTVRAADGSKLQRPQEILNELISEINGRSESKYAMDPLAFAQESKHDPKGAMAVLLSVVNLPFDLDKINQARFKMYNERTTVNGDVKRLKALLSTMPSSKLEVERIDTAALVGRQEEIGKAFENIETANREIFNSIQPLEQERTSTLSKAIEANDRVNDIEDYIGKLKEDMEKQNDLLEQWKSAQQERETKSNDLSARIDSMNVKSSKIRREGEDKAASLRTENEEIKRKLANASNLNAHAEKVEAAKATAGELEEAKAKSTELTRKMENIDERKAQALSRVQMPVDGLTVDDEAGILFDGVPLAQASRAQQLVVGVAMVAALNPALRVVRVEDGSLLDESNMKLLDELCRENEIQAWVERVEGGAGIVIEDGEIVEK